MKAHDVIDIVAGRDTANFPFVFYYFCLRLRLFSVYVTVYIVTSLLQRIVQKKYLVVISSKDTRKGVVVIKLNMKCKFSRKD